jgi:hypothetical protein
VLRPAGRQRRQDAGADREGRGVRQIHRVRLAGPRTPDGGRQDAGCPPHPASASVVAIVIRRKEVRPMNAISTMGALLPARSGD